MKKILFPLWYYSKIPLTDKNKEDIADLNKEFTLSGEQEIAIEYHLKTGRNLLLDTYKQSLSVMGIFLLLILGIYFIT